MGLVLFLLHLVALVIMFGFIGCKNWKMIYFMKGIEFLILTLLYGWAAGYFGVRAFSLTFTMMFNYVLLFMSIHYQNMISKLVFVSMIIILMLETSILFLLSEYW